MDDSDQDFVDIRCPKWLKRNRMRAGEPNRKITKVEQQALSQGVEGDRRRKKKQGGDSRCQLAATQPAGAEAERDVDCRRTTSDSGESSALPSDHREQTGRGFRAKDKVLFKMQHFKRASPQKMVHNINDQPTKQDMCTLTYQHQIQGRLVVCQKDFNMVHHSYVPTFLITSKCFKQKLSSSFEGLSILGFSRFSTYFLNLIYDSIMYSLYLQRF